MWPVFCLPITNFTMSEYPKLYDLVILEELGVNTTQIDPLPPEQCDPLQTPFQKSLIGS